jgi:polyribonucleotide nucleotidyltransferase
MDIKISGITHEIMEIALNQAKAGRLHILNKMDEVIMEPREELSKNAPQITTINISKDKIGQIIGPGGKNIRNICEVSGAKIDIADDGTIKISATSSESSEKAVKMISDITCEPEIGKVYDGTVTKIMDFGAFVNFLGSTDGLVHISEISDERVNAVSDILSEGQKVKVKVLEVDRNGKIRLSMRAIDQDTGEDNPNYQERPARKPSFGGGERSGNGGGERSGNGGGFNGGGNRSDRPSRDRDNRSGGRDQKFAGGPRKERKDYFN